MKDLPLSPVDKELGLCSRFFGESLDRHSINLFLPDAIIEDCTEDGQGASMPKFLAGFCANYMNRFFLYYFLIVFESKDFFAKDARREPVDVDNESFERLGTVDLPPESLPSSHAANPCQAIALRLLIDSRNAKSLFIHDGAQESPLRQMCEVLPAGISGL
jgi:hypothetical protein